MSCPKGKAYLSRRMKCTYKIAFAWLRVTRFAILVQFSLQPRSAFRCCGDKRSGILEARRACRKEMVIRTVKRSAICRIESWRMLTTVQDEGALGVEAAGDLRPLAFNCTSQQGPSYNIFGIFPGEPFHVRDFVLLREEVLADISKRNNINNIIYYQPSRHL